MAAPELQPAYLITGNDRPKVEVALARLRVRFEAGSIERLVAAGKEGASGDDVVAACNAGTLLLGERLVLVTEVDGRRDERGRLTGGWKAADVEAVTDYLRAPAPGTVLCLVGEEVKKDSALAKACAKAGRRARLGCRQAWACRMGRRAVSRAVGEDRARRLLRPSSTSWARTSSPSRSRSTSSRRGRTASRSEWRRCNGSRRRSPTSRPGR